MGVKLRITMPTLILLCIFTASAIPIIRTSPETYGPRVDELQALFIQGHDQQKVDFKLDNVDIWFDIRNPVTPQELEDDGYQVSKVLETFQFHYIAFNVRDQQTPSGGGVPWRAESAPSQYYTYSGAAYTNYVPLNDTAFRHAIAHLIPKKLIEAASKYASAIDSVVPLAQRIWHNPGVDGHPYSRAEAAGTLAAAGYIWQPGAPNPVLGASSAAYWGMAGNWLDPHTTLATDNLETPWDDTLGSPMNNITFVGVPEALAPDSWARDDLCTQEFQAIGLPIKHVSVPFGFLTGTMMPLHQFDMYALEWKVGRFPDHLYGLFHSSQDVINGYNSPGINDAELDAKLETIQFSWNSTAVKQACFDAQDTIAEKLPYVVTVSWQAISASAMVGAPAPTDTLKGMVNSPSYGQENDYTFCSLHWENSIDEDTNPLGIGGSVRYVVESLPTTYHPGYASTTDEWSVIGRLFDGLINIDPYTHEDIPWLATSWTVEDWDYGGSEMGMKTTFCLRNDVYYHDGTHFDAHTCEFSLEFARDQQIARAKQMWQNLVNVEVHNATCFSVYHNVTSLWIFYYVAGPDVWQVNDAACWATMFPPHIYAGTDINFRPEATPHRIVHMGEAVGTGDGSTVLFTLDNAPVATPAVGDPARVVYLDGTPTTAYTINTATGGITFTTAPGTGVAITADYLEEGIAGLTCLVGTGPFVYRGGVLAWGGFARLTAYRSGASPVSTHWWMSAEDYDYLMAEQFHWIGDGNWDGVIDIYDLTKAGKSFALESGDPGYDADSDTAPEPTYHTNDGRVDMRDNVELSKNWGKQRSYA